MSYMYELESNDSSLRLSRPESHLREAPDVQQDFYGGGKRKKRRVRKGRKNNSYTIQMILVNHLMSILIKIQKIPFL